jgi:hypothetical protein
MKGRGRNAGKKKCEEVEILQVGTDGRKDRQK